MASVTISPAAANQMRFRARLKGAKEQREKNTLKISPGLKRQLKKIKKGCGC